MQMRGSLFITNSLQELQKSATDMTPCNTDLTNESSIFDKVFQKNKLTFGLLTPIEGYLGQDIPTMKNHTYLAKMAEKMGFSAIWIRDIPLHDPSFGDVAQIYDPMVYASWLAAQTEKIAIGTAGMILPLREPIHIAKQALSVDQLSYGRFILGVSSGDRPQEYPALGVNFEQRHERFRDAYFWLRSVMEESFPKIISKDFGMLNGELDLVPKSYNSNVPIVAIGRCGQKLSWLAENLDGWIWHQSNLDTLPNVIQSWKSLIGPKYYKPYGYGTFFELDDNPNAPLDWGRGVRGGRNALIKLWKQHEQLGVSHIALNLRISKRPAADTIEEFGSFILPEFL
jgi:luciferase-type oxidoreductase